MTPLLPDYRIAYANNRPGLHTLYEVVDVIARWHRMLGDDEGWYCPNEGFRNTSDLVEDERGVHCPNHPDVELQWLTERNWFFRLSSYQERLERHYAEHPDWVAAGVPQERDARLHPSGPGGLLREPRAHHAHPVTHEHEPLKPEAVAQLGQLGFGRGGVRGDWLLGRQPAGPQLSLFDAGGLP